MTTEPVGYVGLKTISFQSPDKLISQVIQTLVVDQFMSPNGESTKTNSPAQTESAD